MLVTRDQQASLPSLITECTRQSQNLLRGIGDDVIAAINASEYRASKSYAELSQRLEMFVQKGEDVAKRKLIMRSLTFPGMHSKENSICEAHRRTFEWAFQSLDVQFQSWLESTSNQSVYWVTGKPSSGKSTLMKFFRDH